MVMNISRASVPLQFIIDRTTNETFPFGFLVDNPGPLWPPVVQFEWDNRSTRRFYVIGPESFFRQNCDFMHAARCVWMSSGGRLTLTMVQEPPIPPDTPEFHLELSITDQDPREAGEAADPIIIIRTLQ